jgi:spore germination cell wall hydrolase CwlJ-like protein
MRKNQIILDEAARGVRRAFIGSVAGSATMLGVIGVAGAYGMPERLSAQSLSTALTSLQIRLTPMVDSAGPIVDRAMVMAAHVAPKPRSIAIESDDEVILQVPRAQAQGFALAAASPAQVVEPSRVQAIAAPITPPAEAAFADVIAMPKPPVAAPVEKPVAAPVEKPVAAPVKAAEPAPAAPVVATPAEPVITAALPAPAIPVPSRPARAMSRAMPGAMPGAMPDVTAEPPALPAPLVFEQPQLDRIQPLTPLPRLEIVETPKASAPVATVEPVPAAAAPEPAKSEPAKSEPAKSEPAKSEPVKSEPAKFEPVKPARREQLKSELPKPASQQPMTVAALAIPEAQKAEAAKLEAPKPGAAKSEAAKPEAPDLVEAPPETTMTAAFTSHADLLVPDDYPKAVFVHLPLPKPPMSPAQLLDLQGAEYDKAEKCLAQAIYFEARAEPVRGQQAVAQVVLNRVFSPYYPKDVCSVVFQNAHRHLSCQFTFACDGKPEAIRERGSWARANRIARQALHANFWLPEVAKATHYHATYVSPNWIRDMRVMVKHGVHIFYRPRNWGDGSREAQWATPSAEAAAAPTPTKVAQKKKGIRS